MKIIFPFFISLLLISACSSHKPQQPEIKPLEKEVIIYKDEPIQSSSYEMMEIAEEQETEEVPFAIIEELPYPVDCTATDKAGKKACFQNLVNQTIQNNLNVQLLDQTDQGDRARVYVTFKINQEGKVADIKSRGPHPILEKEAERVISLLPRVNPGKQRRRAVIVPFTIPIVYALQ